VTSSTRDQSPRQAYDARLQRHQAREKILQRRSKVLSALRLITFIAGAGLVWLSASTTILSPLWLLVPLVLFIVLVVMHRRIDDAQERARRCAALYRAGLDRLEDRWVGQGVSGDGYCDPAHPYARDLDIFGKGSLFELLCTTRSRCGERTLAQWLLSPAPVAEVCERQQAVAELTPGIDRRQRLALLGEETAGALDPDRLERWGLAPPRQASRLAVVSTWALPCLEVLALIGWFALGWSSTSLIMLLLAHGAISLLVYPWVHSVVSTVDRPAQELALLSQLLDAIEQEQLDAPYLKQLQASLRTDGVRPSRHIARLRVIIELLDSRRNMLFAPVAAFLFWTFHLACAAERWRLRHGRSLATWFDALGRFEALSALSGYAFEHPDDPFPEPAPAAADPRIEAIGLAHPLIPDAQAVGNDLRLDTERKVLIVSGSNMSGKTTLLRTLGVNVALAFAGAPVRARSLRLTPLAIGASITTLDSLLEGRSRFFTEIKRCKQIVDLCAGEAPVLFLLDEILHGTNSHERRIGTELLLRGLLERGAVGLVTTHDLALAELSETLAPHVINVHFEDQMVDGTLHFDYQLRPGTVTKSNALELMRLVGLPVGD
jgi:hypothetical protein